MDFDHCVAHLSMTGILVMYLIQVLVLISIHTDVLTLAFLPPNFVVSLHKSWSDENFSLGCAATREEVVTAQQ
jgi:hypothetical protein